MALDWIVKYRKLILGGVVILLLVNNWSLPLWDQDEAAYAGFAAHMNESGNYVNPDYFYSDDHRKTPFHFWCIAFFFKIFGENEFALRLPSFLFVLGSYLLVIFQLPKFTSVKSTWLSVLVLAGSFLVTVYAKISLTDAGVLFFSTLSGFSVLNVLRKPELKWILFFWLAVALGMMVKGPPVLAFAGVFCVLLLLFHPERKNIWKLHPWFGLPLSFLPLIIWGYASYLQDGGVFLEWMYDWYIKRRIAGSVYGQSGPPGMHLGLILGFFILWVGYVIPGLINGVKKSIKKDLYYLPWMLWFVAGWFFYEFSPSKLPSYVINGHIPLAILTAIWIEKQLENKTDAHRLSYKVTIIVQAVIGLALTLIPLFAPLPENLWLLPVLLGSVLLLIAIITLLVKEYKRLIVQFLTPLIFCIIAWSLSPFFINVFNSSKQVSAHLENELGNNTHYKVAIAHNPGKQPSLPFYIERLDLEPIIANTSKKLDSIVNSPEREIILMNKKQFIAREEYLQDYKLSIVSTLIIDREDTATYYICIPKPLD